MNVLVERYQRRKYVNQEDSQVLYYVRQKSGTVRVMDVNKLADAIEANSSLTAGDVKHAIEAFVEQLRLSLTQGDKVKIDGLGTFYRPALARIPTDRESGYPTEGLGIIIVAKQRNGETGNAYFGHNPEMTKITDYVPPLEFLLKHAK